MTTLLRQLRRRSARYALALAVFQLVILCSSTVALAASARSVSSTMSARDECSCDHTTGVMCPMHRKGGSRSAPTNAPRWCTGVDGAAFAVLPALGALALPERIVALVLSVTESASPVFQAGAPRLLASPPDSPPPRGQVA